MQLFEPQPSSKVARVNIRQQQKNEANELWELNRPASEMRLLVVCPVWSLDLPRLGAMGLAERKEVNLDFSKEDEEKRPWS